MGANSYKSLSPAVWVGDCKMMEQKENVKDEIKSTIIAEFHLPWIWFCCWVDAELSGCKEHA